MRSLVPPHSRLIVHTYADVRSMRKLEEGGGEGGEGGPRGGK